MIIKQSNTSSWAKWFQNIIVIKQTNEVMPIYMYGVIRRPGDYEWNLMAKNEIYINSFEYNDEVDL